MFRLEWEHKEWSAAYQIIVTNSIQYVNGLYAGFDNPHLLHELAKISSTL